MKIISAIWICVFALVPLKSNASSDNTVFIKKIEQLSIHPTWLNLLRYEFDDGEHRHISAIHSKEFFLSEHGKTNPKVEMIQTIDALNKSFDTANSEDSALCRFPARYLWLNKNGLVTNKDLSACENYSKWTDHGDVSSISVVFATGYLGNPASFYGHTLLKFNSKKSHGKTNLEDTSLNYGAIVPPGEGPIPYIFKGLFGGYEAGFSHIKYYFHNHNYGENELRDMWEYELSLTQEEVDFVIAHAWEVLGKKYTYFFLKKNCAHRMAELFNILEGLEVNPEVPFWTVPQTLIQNTYSKIYNGRKLVKEVYHYPSRQTRLYTKYRQLNEKEMGLVNWISKDVKRIDSEAFNKAAEQEKRRVIETLLDYFQLIRERTELEKDAANVSYQKVLSKRFLMNPGQAEFIEEIPESLPHQGRPPSLIRAGITRYEQTDLQTNIVIRPAYYDPLDSNHGHVPYSQLSMAELSLAVDEGSSWYVDYFDVINIKNFNSLATGLSGDKNTAWNLRFGMDPAEPGCIDCSVFRFQGDYGLSFQLTKSWAAAVYAGASLHDKTNGLNENYFVRLSAMSQFQVSDSFNFRVTSEIRDDFNQLSGSTKLTTLEARYEWSSLFDTRIHILDSDDTTVGVSFGYYW